MADFYQNIVPTFTRLDNEDLIQMEKSLLRAAARVPIGIIIPALFKDLSSEAMQNIIHELSSMEFISKIYISLDRATPKEHRSSLVERFARGAVGYRQDRPGIAGWPQRQRPGSLD